MSTDQTPTSVNIKCGPYRVAAYSDAAARVGVSRHKWMLSYLGAAAGSGSLPDDGKWSRRIKGRPHPVDTVSADDTSVLSCKPTAAQAEAWSRAADRAGLTRHQWCKVVLDYAAGFEGLARLFDRMHGLPEK